MATTAAATTTTAEEPPPPPPRPVEEMKRNYMHRIKMEEENVQRRAAETDARIRATFSRASQSLIRECSHCAARGHQRAFVSRCSPLFPETLPIPYINLFMRYFRDLDTGLFINFDAFQDGFILGGWAETVYKI
jgi:hypothetical protein